MHCLEVYSWFFLCVLCCLLTTPRIWIFLKIRPYHPADRAAYASLFTAKYIVNISYHLSKLTRLSNGLCQDLRYVRGFHLSKLTRLSNCIAGLKPFNHGFHPSKLTRLSNSHFSIQPRKTGFHPLKLTRLSNLFKVALLVRAGFHPLKLTRLRITLLGQKNEVFTL